MVIKFIHLVLKKYGKSFSKMCGSPDFNFSTFPAFVFFLVSLITLLVFQEKSRFIGNGSVSRFPEMYEAKIVFFGPEKAQKPCRQASTKPITGLWSRNLNFRLWVPLKGIHSHWLQIRLQHAKVFGSRSRMIWSQKH